MNKVAIIGAGGLGREIKNLLSRDHAFGGFIDDKAVSENYLGDLTIANTLNETDFIVAIGDPSIKKLVVNRIDLPQDRFTNLVSEHAVVKKEFLKGHDIIICDGVIFTVNCQIGSHVLLNLNATVGHDVIIGDYCSIMPGANISGNVTIGETTLIGSAAVILQGITIGKNVKVGAGAVVTKNVPDNCTVVGVPARILKNDT